MKTSPTSGELTQPQLRQYLEEQETLFAIAGVISSNLQIDVVMQLVAEHMARLVNAASCAISEWDATQNTLTVKVEYIRPDQVDLNDPIKDLGYAYALSDYPVTAASIRDHKPFVVYLNDLAGDSQERNLLRAFRWHAVAGIPLVVQSRVVGLAEIYLAEEAQVFDNHDLRLLQVLANQVAIAIDNARLFTTVQTSEATMRDLSLRLLKVQEEERRRIAQALHDELGQLLTALKIDVDLARRKLPESATSSRQRLDEASILTDEVMTKIRALTIELRPPVLDDLGIVPTLRWYLERVALRTNLQVQLEVPQISTRPQPQIETAIYRTVQEGLTNVIRHAQATQVWVRLKYSADQLTVSIEDNGRGFDSRTWLDGELAQQTLGLIGIKERAMLLGGCLSILSQPGQGTQIKLELPVHFLSEG